VFEVGVCDEWDAGDGCWLFDEQVVDNAIAEFFCHYICQFVYALVYYGVEPFFWFSVGGAYLVYSGATAYAFVYINEVAWHYIANTVYNAIAAAVFVAKAGYGCGGASAGAGVAYTQA
jgi:hypothetical protein